MGDRNDPNGAQFEITVDGTPRTYRDVKAMAIEAAKLLKEKSPGLAVSVRDMRDGSITEIGWDAGKAFALEAKSA
jgi:hypothetical protein